MAIFKKYSEKNFCNFIQKDNDIISDEFFDYLYRNSNIQKYKISPDEAYRIDLIADNIYGNKNLYWILLRLNCTLNMAELAEHVVISYIDITDIESAYMAWKANKK